MLCGAGGGLIFLTNALNEPTLQQQGQVIEATVTETSHECQATGCDLKVTYHFSSNDELYTDTESVSPPTWEQAQATGKINILYLPTKPWVHHAADESGSLFIAMNLVAATISVLVALFGLVRVIQVVLAWVRAPAPSTLRWGS